MGFDAVALLGVLACGISVAALVIPPVVYARSAGALGGVLFALYGAWLGAWPLTVFAVALTIFHGVRLVRELRPRPGTSDVAALPLEPHHPFLDDFLTTHAADIAHSQPDFDPADVPPFVRLITRHGLPAGVFLARPEGRELQVVLDYAIPRYRDSRSARWLFGEGRSTFTDAGFTRLVASPRTYEHQSYLETLGFVHEGSRLVKEL